MRNNTYVAVGMVISLHESGDVSTIVSRVLKYPTKDTHSHPDEGSVGRFDGPARERFAATLGELTVQVSYRAKNSELTLDLGFCIIEAGFCAQLGNSRLRSHTST